MFIIISAGRTLALPFVLLYEQHIVTKLGVVPAWFVKEKTRSTRVACCGSSQKKCSLMWNIKLYLCTVQVTYICKKNI